MVTRKQSINNFSEKTDKLINGGYLFTATRIKDVLKALTSSKMFFELISFCMEGFDFDEVCEKYALSGEPFPTEDKKELIAFGVSLLSAIDAEQIELLDVLTSNYKSNYVDSSYRAFASSYLVPFKEAIVESAQKMIEMSAEKECGDKSNPLFDAPTEPVFNNEQSDSFMPFAHIHEADYSDNHPRSYLTCYNDIQRIISSEKSKIAYSKLKDNEKTDLLEILDEFRSKLDRGTKEELRQTFRNYRYAVSNFKKLTSDVADIERILKFCNIL